MSNEHLCLVLDVNSAFLTALGPTLSALLQSIRTAMGMLLLQNIGNRITVYAVDTYDAYPFDRRFPPTGTSSTHGTTTPATWSRSSTTLSSSSCWTASRRSCTRSPRMPGHSPSSRSAWPRCFAVSSERNANANAKEFNADPDRTHRIGFVTWNQFSLAVPQYTQFLALATHAAREGTRFDVVQLEVDTLSREMDAVRLSEARSLARDEALKLGA